ncbi:unnamed protein product [Trichobilharzia szidati]|nr:unnamed protein product [Trichobilharzia szidati]
MTHEERISYLVQSLDKRIKSIESERNKLLEEIQHLKKQNIAAGDNLHDCESQPPTSSNIVHKKGTLKQKSSRLVDGESKKIHSQLPTCPTTSNAKQPNRFRSPNLQNNHMMMKYDVSDAFTSKTMNTFHSRQHIDAVCCTRLNNLIQKLRSLTDHWNYYHHLQQACSHSHLSCANISNALSRINCLIEKFSLTSRRPDALTWIQPTNCSTDNNCLCTSNSYDKCSSSGSARPKTPGVVINPSTETESLTKERNSSKPPSTHCIPVNKSASNNTKLCRAVEVVTTVRPCQNVIATNKPTTSNAKRQCKKGSSTQKDFPIICKVIEDPVPIRKIAWR